MFTTKKIARKKSTLIKNIIYYIIFLLSTNFVFLLRGRTVCESFYSKQFQQNLFENSSKVQYLTNNSNNVCLMINTIYWQTLVTNIIT